MKKIFFILLIIVFNFSFSESIKEYLITNEDYYSLINTYNENYIYEFKQEFPIMPAKNIHYKIENAIIDSYKISILVEDTIYDFIPIAGEDPLPLNIKPDKRSSLINKNYKNSKDIIEIKIGKKGKNSIIFGKLNNFRYVDNNLIIIKKALLEIFYSQTTIQESKLNPSILIITEDSLKTYWNEYNKLYPNIHTLLKSANDIQILYPSLSISEGLRIYLQELYADSNLIALLIAEDTDKIPGIYIQLSITPQLPDANQILLTDKYYSCLDGNWNGDNDTIIGEMEDSIDIFPDILIGRIPLSDSIEIFNFINKIEKIKTNTSDTILVVASLLDANTDGSIGLEHLIDYVGIDEPIKRLYESSGNLSSSTFIEAINASPFAIIHDGHGSSSAIQTGVDYTYNAGFDTLSNSLPILLYSVSCWSAAYDYDCIAEHFVLSPNGGGFYIGNSRYGWYTPYFPGFGTGDLLNTSFFDNFINYSTNPVNALDLTFENFSYQIDHFNDWRWQFLCLTYLGDPLINLKRNINSLSINFLRTVKNHYLTFSVLVEDSVIVQAITNSDTITKILYKYNNVFSELIDSSDSIYISLFSNSNIDTSFQINTFYSYLSQCNLVNYNFEYLSNDTIVLHAYLSVNILDTFIIKTKGITDTLIELYSDSVFYIDSDTMIDFYFLRTNNFSDNNFIVLYINNDSLQLQTAFNLSENIRISLLPDKIHYNVNDSIKININLKNLSINNYNNLSLTVYSDSLSDTNYILIDSLIAKDDFDTTILFIANNTNGKCDININIADGNNNIDKTFFISLNDDNTYFDFESNSNFSVDSSITYFHITNNESYSGNYSFYSGYEDTNTYGINYITTLYSDYFVYDTLCFLGFATKYNVEAGFDYCVIYIEQNSVKIPIITLDGESFEWETYIFLPPKDSSYMNQSSRLVFNFYSENDDIQYEGWYIDDVLLPSSNISNIKFFKNNNSNNYSNIMLFEKTINGNIQFLIPDNNNYKFTLYDISGRFIKNGFLNKDNKIITINKAGKYFIKINNSVFDITVIK